MDSKWLHHASGSSNNYNQNNNAGDTVDLTLKLGLPDDHDTNDQSHRSQHVNLVPMAPCMSNFNFSGHYTPQGGNQYGMNGGGHLGAANRSVMTSGGNANHRNYEITNEGANIDGFNQYNMANSDGSSHYTTTNFNANSQIAWTPEMTNHPSHYMNSSSSRGVGHYAGGSVVGVPHYPNTTFGPAGLPLLAPTRKTSRHQRTGSYIDPNKRCTNYNCNTNDTPMWRKGPLGPKTLCNACGIKYRKEEEKRKAKEAANGQHD